MFVLSTIADLISIKPADLRKPVEEALEDNINKKYANKVLQNVGLCICLWDVIKASEGLISQGDGTVNVNIEFRLVVFRPFKGEILQGKILKKPSPSPEGIRIGLDFFTDVWIPAPTNLFEGSRFDYNEQVWIWCPDGENGDSEFFYDENEVVRFRVEDEIWHDASPGKPEFTHGEGGNETKERPVPYAIIGSMQQAGLGPVYWWNQDADQDAEAGAEMDE